MIAAVRCMVGHVVSRGQGSTMILGISWKNEQPHEAAILGMDRHEDTWNTTNEFNDVSILLDTIQLWG